MDDAEEVAQLVSGHHDAPVVPVILDHGGAPHLAPAVLVNIWKMP